MSELSDCKKHVHELRARIAELEAECAMHHRHKGKLAEQIAKLSGHIAEMRIADMKIADTIGGVPAEIYEKIFNEGYEEAKEYYTTGVGSATSCTEEVQAPPLDTAMLRSVEVRTNEEVPVISRQDVRAHLGLTPEPPPLGEPQSLTPEEVAVIRAALPWIRQLMAPT